MYFSQCLRLGNSRSRCWQIVSGEEPASRFIDGCLFTSSSHDGWRECSWGPLWWEHWSHPRVPCAHDVTTSQKPHFLTPSHWRLGSSVWICGYTDVQSRTPRCGDRVSWRWWRLLEPCANQSLRRSEAHRSADIALSTPFHTIYVHFVCSLPRTNPTSLLLIRETSSYHYWLHKSILKPYHTFHTVFHSVSDTSLFVKWSARKSCCQKSILLFH